MQDLFDWQDTKTAELESVGGENLAGSGFEAEEPEIAWDISVPNGEE